MSTCSATCEASGTLAAANERIELTVRTEGRRLAERRVWCFEPGAVFELPPEAPRGYTVTSPPREAAALLRVPGRGSRPDDAGTV